MQSIYERSLLHYTGISMHLLVSAMFGVTMQIRTIRFICDIVIYRTAVQVFSRWTFLESLGFSTNGRHVFFINFFSKIVFNKEVSSGRQGKQMCCLYFPQGLYISGQIILTALIYTVELSLQIWVHISPF